jgi:nitroreductase
MSDILELIESRRSIRHFQDRPIPPEVVDKLLRAGQLAPSRANSQPWRFIVIDDQATKEALFEAVYKQKLVLAAPLLITVLGVIDPRKSVPHRTQELVEANCFGQDVKEFADRVLDDWTMAELKVDAALNSAIAATHIILAAHSLGLGCCWVKLCQDDKVLEILGVPSDYYNAGVLAIGYPDEHPKQRPRVPLETLVYRNRYGQH